MRNADYVTLPRESFMQPSQRGPGRRSNREELSRAPKGRGDSFRDVREWFSTLIKNEAGLSLDGQARVAFSTLDEKLRHGQFSWCDEVCLLATQYEERESEEWQSLVMTLLTVTGPAREKLERRVELLSTLRLELKKNWSEVQINATLRGL